MIIPRLFSKKTHSIGFQQGRGSTEESTILVDGEKLDPNSNKGSDSYAKLFKNRGKKKTVLGDATLRESRNPFKKDLFLDDYSENIRDESNRKITSSYRSNSEKGLYREWLRMQRQTGVDSGVSKKEMKNMLRNTAKQRNIKKGALTVGSSIVVGVGAKKLYDKKKAKKEEKP